MSLWPEWKENRPFAGLLTLFLAVLVIFFGLKSVNVFKENRQIGKPVPYEHTISIEGQGKVTAKPDIASVMIGVQSKGDTVADSQLKNTQTMNALISSIKNMGIAEDDLLTANYFVYQEQVWNPTTQISESKQWIVSQNITVKIRDASKISTVLGMAGQSGVTNISGPTFTIDDPTALKDQAREKAIKDAEMHARQIAGALGMQIEKVIGYSEYSSDNGPIPMYDRMVTSDSSLGAPPAPTIQTGTTDVKLTVNITYKLVE